jgi:hypothetical protein
MEEINFNKQKFRIALEYFKEYSKEARFRKDTEERRERKAFFQKITRGKIDELTFAGLIKKLWAAQIWANQDYLVNKIIKDNGIQKISNELSILVSHRRTPGERYEQFLKKIKGMGPSMVTEILCHTDPKNAGIWNDKVRKAIAWLEIKNISYDKYRVTAKEYDNFNQLIKQLTSYLKGEKYQDVDLLFVDYFLWEVCDKFAKQEKIKTPIIGELGKERSRHTELRDKIAAVGSWLGFDVETEKHIAIGARVDIIWKAKIANLGAVSYIFEVQDRGSIDSLLLNLQKAQTNSTVQKLIIVSDIDQLEKIKSEVKTMPENFRKATSFWDTGEVENVYQNLEQVTNSITKLNLIGD